MISANPSAYEPITAAGAWAGIRPAIAAVRNAKTKRVRGRDMNEFAADRVTCAAADGTEVPPGWARTPTLRRGPEREHRCVQGSRKGSAGRPQTERAKMCGGAGPVKPARTRRRHEIERPRAGALHRDRQCDSDGGPPWLRCRTWGLFRLKYDLPPHDRRPHRDPLDRLGRDPRSGPGRAAPGPPGSPGASRPRVRSAKTP